jgi:hypothetical protein
MACALAWLDETSSEGRDCAAPASKKIWVNVRLYVGGFRVNNQIDVRLAGDPRDFARQSICRLPRSDMRTRHHQNKSGGSLRW